MKRKNAFSLIELVAVLVIMAIIALIATPLVLTLVNNAKASANKRSIDVYGKAVELAAMTYLMDNGEYPTDLGSLTVEYTGKEITCNVMTLNNDGSIYLSECSVGESEVKDKNTEDGWYHYGAVKEANTENYDFRIGDIVTYKGIEFYVIKNSETTSDSVTLLKAEALTVDEVNTYGAGHVNMYYNESVGTAYDKNGYGGMTYYGSPTCGYGRDGWISDGCTNDYASSEIKYVIDAWVSATLISSDLKADETGYSARLITIDELTTNLGFDANDESSTDETPSWVYNENYNYWTMSPKDNSALYLLDVSWYGSLGQTHVNHYISASYTYVVRPVITLKKSAIK